MFDEATDQTRGAFLDEAIRELTLIVALQSGARDLTRLRPRYTSRCIFCGGSPTTLEHVWPHWSHPFIKKGRKSWEAMQATQFRDRSIWSFQQFGGDPHDWQVKCVDQACNGGWMKLQEDRFKPLFEKMLKATDGNPVRLGPDEQTTVATWFAVKAIVQEYARGGRSVSHYRQRQRLRTTQKLPPRSWRIWIGNYTPGASETMWSSFPFLLLPNATAQKRTSELARYYNSQTASYVLGNLFILLLRSPDEFFVTQWRHQRPVGELRQIWPLTGFSFQWPLKTMSDENAYHAVNGVRDFAEESASKPVRVSPQGLITG